MEARTAGTPRDWDVLLLATGATHLSYLRDAISGELRAAGLGAVTWDRPGYDAGSGLYPMEACVRAAESAPFVVAFLDRDEGSELPPEDLTLQTLRRLHAHDVLKPAPAATRTVTQVEVLVALRLARRPVIVLLPDGLLSDARSVLAEVEAAAPDLRPVTVGALPAAQLANEGRWLELVGAYEVPAPKDMPTVRHAAFLLEVARTTFVHSYRPGDLSGPTGFVRGRLDSLALPTEEVLANRIEKRLGRKRNPFDVRSVLDLRHQKLIVDPPFSARSGAQHIPGSQLLPDYGSDPGALAQLLCDDKSVLALGDPGIGKTTTALLVAHAALTRGLVSDPRVLVLSLRGASAEPGVRSPEEEAERLLREEIGATHGRAPWPGPLPGHLRLVLDGLDETAMTATQAEALVTALGQRGSLLVTCRRSDFQRGLSATNTAFDAVVEMLPWGRPQRSQFVAALRANGQSLAADYVERNGDREPELLGVPLWLACAVFACENSAIESDQMPESDYALLLKCAKAVATQESHRAGLGTDGADRLSAWWGHLAWEDNRHRRLGGRARQEVEVLALAGVPEDVASRQAVASQLDVEDGFVLGFHHDVFRDFWLALHVIAALKVVPSSPTHVAGLLGPQRTRLANRLIRAGLSRPGPGQAPVTLMQAFAATSDPLARNAILYLLGRIDDSPATRGFLRMQWADQSHHLFVRYSAGWAAAVAGDEDTEEEFFTELSQAGELDELNRAYHRLYYEDSWLERVDLPEVDDLGPAENAVTQLLERIGGQEPQLFRLRRVDLLTLLRLCQTRAVMPTEVRKRVDLGVALPPSAPLRQRADVERLVDDLRALMRSVAVEGA